MRLIPVGSKLLITKQERKAAVTDNNIEIIQNDLKEGVVVEVSEEFKDLYSIGDIVLYSSGAGQGEYYNGQNCVWIDGRGIKDGGDVWSKVIYDEGIVPPVTFLDERNATL